MSFVEYFSKSEPGALGGIQRDAAQIGFTMACDRDVGALLRLLAASKPGGFVLDIGSGPGTSAAWLLDGMDDAARLQGVDTDGNALAVAREHLGADARTAFTEQDGAAFLASWTGPLFELIFADAWPGKYDALETALALVAPGGFYIIDDMLPQPNWPAGHSANVETLCRKLAARDDFIPIALPWASGVCVLVRRA